MLFRICGTVRVLEGATRLSSCARVVFAAALLLFCAAGQGWAQNTPPPPNTPANAGAAIHVRTNVVMVRVVVRDAKGNPVSGLARSDFHVFDNKKEQSITHFSAETPTAAGLAVAQAPASSGKNSVARSEERRVGK